MCASCGYVMDGASPADPGHRARPTAGSLALCINCGAPYVRRGGKWDPMTSADWAGLLPEEQRELLTAAFARGLVIKTDLRRDQGGGTA